MNNIKKSFLLLAALIFAQGANAVAIDVTSATLAPVSATSMTLNGVKLGSLAKPVWATFDWDATKNAFLLSDFGDTQSSVNGRWMLNYDWGCTGTAYQAEMNLQDDGTCIVQGEEGNACNWTATDTTFTLTFYNNTVYSGTIDGANMTGTMVYGEDSTSTGCWTANRLNKKKILKYVRHASSPSKAH